MLRWKASGIQARAVSPQRSSRARIPIRAVTGLKIVGNGILSLHKVHKPDHEQGAGAHLKTRRIHAIENRIFRIFEPVGGVDGREEVAVADMQPAAIALVGDLVGFNIYAGNTLPKRLLDRGPMEVDVVVPRKKRDLIPL